MSSRRKPTKADQADSEKMLAPQAESGIQTIGLYWTFGGYDAVRIFEAPDEKTAMKALTKAPDYISTETMVAITRADATKLLD